MLCQVCHGTITRYNIGYKQFGHKSPFQFFDLDRYQWDRTRSSLHIFQAVRTSGLYRFQFLLRRLQQWTKYEVVVQVSTLNPKSARFKTKYSTVSLLCCTALYRR